MQKVDIAISFDTTGSMYPCITEVRRKVSGMVNELFNKLGNKLRIAIIAHGDYCDKNRPYTIKYNDFSQNPREIISFINSVENTHGGDADECYELVLHTAKRLNWSVEHGASRALIVIGDADPHGISYSMNTERLDWRIEAARLADEDVKIYACHAMADIRRSSTAFYKEIAAIGGGVYITLAQFSSLPHLLMGIMYKEASPSMFEEYVQRVESENSMSRDLHMSFTNMGSKTIKPISDARVVFSRKTSSVGYSTAPDITELVPVSPSRFQVFNVDKKQSIRDFVNDQHVMFQPGRGFYELTKSVKVQQHKEIILVHKKTKDIYTGAQVRKLLGLLPQVTRGGSSATERLSSHSVLRDYDIFIQSTSYNRELLPGTFFMYEVDGWDKDTSVASSPTLRTTVPGPEIPTPPKKKSKATPGGASIKYKSSISIPVAAKTVAVDFSGVELRMMAYLGLTKENAEAAARYLHDTNIEEFNTWLTKPMVEKKATVIPEKLKKAQEMFDYKTANPDTPWSVIALKYGYETSSGARKAVKRYSDYIATAV